MTPLLLVAAAAASLGATPAAAPVSLGPDESWKVVEGRNDLNYYKLKQEDGRTVFHARYPAHVPTVTIGREVPESAARRTRVRWSWRVHAFPTGAPESNEPQSDSACAVYVTYGSNLHRTSLKYVWSATLPKGTVIGPRKGLFADVVTIVLEGPGGTDAWRTEEVDVAADWSRFYGDGKPASAAPDLKGLGLLTDGDDSRSNPSADYADFVLP